MEAVSPMKAIRFYFDSNVGGTLTSSDAAFANFKVLVSNTDGLTTAMTLTQVGSSPASLTMYNTGERVELR